MKSIRSLKNLKGKVVLLRADFNAEKSNLLKLEKKSFISMSSRAKFLVILFIIAIVLEVVATVSNLSQMKLLGDMAEGWRFVPDA